MKLNHKFVRTVTTTAAVLGAAAMLSVGAFAAEADINDPAAAGYLPPQEQMVQGDIALHSADVAIGEKDPTYGGYGAPEGNPIQGNIMLISGDELAAPSADAAAKKSEARYTVKGLFGREVLYTARQKDSVLTLDVPAGSATFRTTVQDMQTLLNEGVSTLVVQTEKGSTTLNLSLLALHQQRQVQGGGGPEGHRPRGAAPTGRKHLPHRGPALPPRFDRGALTAEIK